MPGIKACTIVYIKIIGAPEAVQVRVIVTQVDAIDSSNDVYIEWDGCGREDTNETRHDADSGSGRFGTTGIINCEASSAVSWGRVLEVIHDFHLRVRFDFQSIVSCDTKSGRSSVRVSDVWYWT